jgi:hypothetical protein
MHQKITRMAHPVAPRHHGSAPYPPCSLLFLRSCRAHCAPPKFFLGLLAAPHLFDRILIACAFALGGMFVAMSPKRAYLI